MTEKKPLLKDWPYLRIGVVGVVAIVGIAVTFRSGSTSSAANFPRLSISNETANLLEVNPLVTLTTKTPSFKLTDQNGRPTQLSDYTGDAVVLTFGDDKCTDLCTLLAQDVLAADKDLGTSGQDVQFVSINANPFYPSVSATKLWTDDHGLGTTSNWHFLTGSAATLAKLAKTYGVDVELDHKTKTIIHGADIFFINSTGQEVQIGQFGVESANTGLYAHAMAQLAVDTLPSGKNIRVAGPTLSTSTTASAAVNSTPPPVELPELDSAVSISSASYRGKYVVLNFWASTCPICTTELPGLQKASQSDGTKSLILGIDVSDPASAATAFIKKAGVTYPVLRDADGVTAAQFEIPGLPYTVILDPKGKVVVRHPGSITTEQLEYLIQTLEAQGSEG